MQRFWIGAAALLLTMGFMYLRFPYERLAERIEGELRQSMGLTLRLVDVGPRPTLLGPGISAGPVYIDTPDVSQQFDEVLMRPAWSTSWLALSPAVYLVATRDGIHVEGTLTLGSPPHFEGQLVDTDPRALLGESSSLELSGLMDAEFSLALGPPSAGGPVVFVLVDGVFSHPLLPLQIPFDRLDADFELDPQGAVTLHSAELQSPMLNARATGTLGQPPRGTLDVTLDLAPTDAVSAVLLAQGMRPGRDGNFSIHLGGTADNPALR